MADNGGNKQEMSMEMRLLIAFLLMGVVMFVTQYWLKPKEGPQPVKPAATAANQGETAVTPPPAAPEKAQAAPPAAAATAAATPQEKIPTFTVDTKLFKVTFSNQG